jgi:acetyl-CoA carboxylase carboxyltransferase component
MTATKPTEAPPEVSTAAARLEGLLDPRTFTPIRSEVRSASRPDLPPGDGVVCGSGTIDGRKVFCYSQDARVLGGSLGQVHADSLVRVLDLAGRFGNPIVGIHHSGGARIQEGVASLAGYARVFARHVKLRKQVPQIALVFGPCAGGAAYGPALMDFVVMPATGTYLFLTGPDVVRQVTGEDVSFEDLGGAQIQGRSGLASLIGDDEEDSMRLVHRLLRYLPSPISTPAPHRGEWRAPEGDPGEVVPIASRRTYDVRQVIARVFDQGSFLELKSDFARNLVTGFARLEGGVVGIVANQPQALGGAIDVQGSQKGAWFVAMCDRFRIPIAVFVDTPGFLPGRSQELGGVIPHGAAFLASFASADVPKVTIVLRKAYGGAYIVMNSKDLGADYYFAWPSAEIAVVGARPAVQILERRRLAAADDPDALRTELEAEYQATYATPWPAARAGFTDEVIEPRETRRRLVWALED